MGTKLYSGFQNIVFTAPGIMSQEASRFHFEHCGKQVARGGEGQRRVGSPSPPRAQLSSLADKVRERLQTFFLLSVPCNVGACIGIICLCNQCP